MPREVGAYEAKTRLPGLLREVAQGGHITITIRGRAVAELTPARGGPGGAADAVEAMRRFRLVKGVAAGTVRDWIDEGRR